MNTIRYHDRDFEVKDIVADQPSKMILITAVAELEGGVVVDILQVRYHGYLKQTSVEYTNVMFPARILKG